MNPKAIMVAIGGGEGSEAALQAALTLGARFDSYVEVLHVRIDANDAIPVMAEGLSGTIVQELIDSLEAQADKRARAAEALFHAHCVRPGLALPESYAAAPKGKHSARFRILEGRFDDVVARVGRLFDLIVVERPPDDENSRYPLVLEAALFNSGRPVLLVPPAVTAPLGKHIMIGWNGSAEAASALGAALPFLAQAERVSVVTVRDGGQPDPSAATEYLALHGIAAETRVLQSERQPVGEQLLHEAAARQADLLVMGAYGRSRLRELVLGGVTRSVVTRAAIPVLMAR